MIHRLSLWNFLWALYLLAALAVNLNSAQNSLAGTCWYNKRDMPTARRALAAVESDGYIYVIGGRDENTDNGDRYDVVERYNPATDTWATMTPMPTARAWLVVAAVNGKTYAIGGSNSTGKLETVEEYDPDTDTWTTKTSMDVARARDDAVVGVVNNKIYVISGHRGETQKWVDEYDPSTDTWTTKADMPAPRALACSAVVNGKIYVIGGLYNGNQASNFVFDPVANTWQTRASMPTARSRLTAGVIGGKIYVIGGFNNTDGRLGLVENYDPDTNHWATEYSMPTKRSGLSAAAAGGLIYVFGGMNSEEGPVLGVTEAADVACTNTPPNVPSDLIPESGWTNRPLNTILSWTGSDPDPGDTLTYDAYFGKGLTPPLVSSNQSAATYDLFGHLNPYSWYYWRIVARDNHGAVTSGPRLKFQTGRPLSNAPILFLLLNK